ncbi:MAG: hypothetical protein AB7N76_05225 [Planctomycetota bacterium]
MKDLNPKWKERLAACIVAGVLGGALDYRAGAAEPPPITLNSAMNWKSGEVEVRLLKGQRVRVSASFSAAAESEVVLSTLPHCHATPGPRSREKSRLARWANRAEREGVSWAPMRHGQLFEFIASKPTTLYLAARWKMTGRGGDPWTEPTYPRNVRVLGRAANDLVLGMDDSPGTGDNDFDDIKISIQIK